MSVELGSNYPGRVDLWDRPSSSRGDSLLDRVFGADSWEERVADQPDRRGYGRTGQGSGRPRSAVARTGAPAMMESTVTANANPRPIYRFISVSLGIGIVGLILLAITLFFSYKGTATSSDL